MDIARTITQHTQKKNLLQLIYLRGIAIIGQLTTVLFVHYGLGIALPLKPMLATIALICILNGISCMRYKQQERITGMELFLELLLDVAALTALLYFSGGASNPFISLFLLQVIIGAVLLRSTYAWALLGITLSCYLFLTFYYRELHHFDHYHLGDFFNLHVHGMMIGYALSALLLVLFLTTITQNLRDRDARLALEKQQFIEEEHILRMGLLAAGAAHELGTPLTTILVILQDLQRFPIPNDAAALKEDISVMQTEILRCKEIVSGILLSSGQLRGEDSESTTLRRFVNGVVDEWKAARRPIALHYACAIDEDMAIVTDRVIRQMLLNIFDNALDASPQWVGISAAVEKETLVIRVEDKGSGFHKEVLENFAKPYMSTKDGFGRGMGLFLVVNALRKLGGNIAAVNNVSGGATVSLAIPLDALATEGLHGAA